MRVSFKCSKHVTSSFKISYKLWKILPRFISFKVHYGNNFTNFKRSSSMERLCYAIQGPNNVQTKLVFIQFTKLLVQEYCKIGSIQVHQMFETSYIINSNFKL